MKYLIIVSLALLIIYSCQKQDNALVIPCGVNSLGGISENEIDTIYDDYNIWIGPRRWVDSAHSAYLKETQAAKK